MTSSLGNHQVIHHPNQKLDEPFLLLPSAPVGHLLAESCRIVLNLFPFPHTTVPVELSLDFTKLLLGPPTGIPGSSLSSLHPSSTGLSVSFSEHVPRHTLVAELWLPVFPAPFSCAPDEPSHLPVTDDSYFHLHIFVYVVSD